MQTDHLHDFIDLCATLNFTRSAQRLNLDQSTLSRHIMTLEKDFGAPLFDRSQGTVRLTQAGRALYGRARAIVKSLDDMQALAQSSYLAEMTTIRVSGSTIQPTLNRFMTRMSALASARNLPIRFEYARVRSISSELPPRDTVEELDDFEADMLIEFFLPSSEALGTHRSLPLCTEPLIALARADNPLCQKRNLRVRDLSGSPFVLFSMYQHCTSLYGGALYAAGCTPKSMRTVIVDDMLVVPETLAKLSKDEVTVLQANFAHGHGFDDDGTDRIRTLHLHDDAASLPVHLMWRPDDNRAAVNLAVDLAQEVKAGFTHRKTNLPWR